MTNSNLNLSEQQSEALVELLAGDALEAVTLAVFVLEDAASHLSCSVLRLTAVETIAIRADTAHLGRRARGDAGTERCLTQKQLIQRVDPLQLLRSVGNVISHAGQYF